MTGVPVYLSPKRKRGRPRKDTNLFKDNNFKSLVKPHIRKNLNDYKDDGMVGVTVYGVIEGSFDAGFLISVRTSNNGTPFRGVIFQSDKVVPVTPANDLAPDAKMYQRQVSATANTPPSQFNGISPISPCSPQTSATPYVLTRHSAFSATEPTLSKVGSCLNEGGNITTHGNSRLVNYQSSSTCPIENLGIMEHNESMFGSNMNNKVNTGDMESESSIESMFDSFLRNGMKSNLLVQQNKLYSSALEPHPNFAPQSQFETQQNATIVKQCVREKEPQVINSELDLTDIYHSEPNSLDLNFHQNLFSYQHEFEEQPKYPASNFDQHAFIECASTSPSLMLNLASNKQERYLFQEHKPSNVRVETKYLDPFFQSPEHETKTVLNSLLETYEHGLGLEEEMLTSEPFSVQSTTERCINQTSSSTDTITDMDYVLSEVVSFAESQFWDAKFT